jgi:hypothetical protein
MPRMSPGARKLTDWLDRSGPVQQALSRTEQLVRINVAFREWLREPWSDAVRIVALEGDTAVVHAANSAAATVLRFRSPSIIAFVRERYNPACTDLQIKVQPDTYTAI